MVFLFHSGTFQGLDEDITGDLVVTGVGFTPKLLIMSATSHDVNIFDASGNMNFGFASSNDTSKQRALGMNTNDSESAGTVNHFWHPTCIWTEDFPGGIPGPNVVCELKSFDSDGFTLNYVLNFSSTANTKIGYLALGGDDMSSTNVGHFTAPSSTGDFSVNGVGFLPDFVLLATSNSTQDATNTAGDGSFSLGAFNGVGEQFTTAFISENNADPTDTARYQRTDKCLAIFNVSNAAALTHEATFVGMDADGFTINFSTASTANKRVAYAAFKGPATKIGSFTSPTAGTLPVSQSVTGAGLDPKSLILLSVGGTTSSAIQSHNRWCIGGGDNSINRYSNWIGDKDNVGTTVVASRFDNNQIMRVSTEAASAGSTTTDALADLSMLDTDGFTLNWSVIDTGNAYEIIYLAFADAEAPPPILTFNSINSLTGNTVAGIAIHTADLDHIDTIVE